MDFWKEFDKFQSKAGCAYSQQVARQAWNKISDSIDKEWKTKMLIAWDHYITGEGREELDSVCKLYKETHS